MSTINADKLKEYIIENNCVEQILESLECHSIKEYPKEWRAALPNGTNKTAVSVKKDTLSIAIRSSDQNAHGDIFTLVMTLKNMSFGQANKYIHSILGLKYSFKRNEKENVTKDPLAIFKKVKRTKRIINKDVPLYDDSCLKEYINLPYIGWVREGIMPDTCKRFNIGYSYDKRRIIIPWRKWDGDENEYLGIVGRTTVPKYELLDIPKYFGIIPFSKGINIYGLNENYKYIQEAGYIVVFEAEKSTLKRASRLDNTGSSLGNCEITDEQVRILISLDVEIVIALDEGIDINHIRKECEKFYPIRKVSYIYDKWDLIPKGSKNSPADMPNKIYNFLFKHRTVYDEKERKLYKDWLEKQNKN